MQWLRLDFELKGRDREILMAWLQYAGAESIVECDDKLEVYCNSDHYDSFMHTLSDLIDDTGHSKNIIVNENWNAVWESGFGPVDIGPVHIRAEFHPPSQSDYELIINPKMAFGTGHHATTYMMIDALAQMDLTEKYVLDYGCGTGILAVMAALRNAKFIHCIDIQSEAVVNCVEHFALNNIDPSQWKVEEGDLDILDTTSFDLILANINKSVLLSQVDRLSALLKPGSELIMSGILKEYADELRAIYESKSLITKSIGFRDEWLFIHMYK